MTFRSSSTVRSLSFARQHFDGCPAHTAEAIAVHRAVEMLTRENHAGLAPDRTFAEVFERAPFGASLGGHDSLDTVEFVMSLEDEIEPSVSGDDDGKSLESAMFQVLLGPHATASTWAAETLGSRSIRGLVEERVRIRGDCSCPTAV